jgi:hypothetical protein
MLNTSRAELSQTEDVSDSEVVLLEPKNEVEVIEID